MLKSLSGRDLCGAMMVWKDVSRMENSVCFFMLIPFFRWIESHTVYQISLCRAVIDSFCLLSSRWVGFILPLFLSPSLIPPPPPHPLCYISNFGLKITCFCMDRVKSYPGWHMADLSSGILLSDRKWNALMTFYWILIAHWYHQQSMWYTLCSVSGPLW